MTNPTWTQELKERAGDVAAKVGTTFEAVKAQAKETAEEIGENLGEIRAGSQAKAEEIGGSLGSKAEEIGGTLGKLRDETVSKADQLSGAFGAFRNRAKGKATASLAVAAARAAAAARQADKAAGRAAADAKRQQRKATKGRRPVKLLLLLAAAGAGAVIFKLLRGKAAIPVPADTSPAPTVPIRPAYQPPSKSAADESVTTSTSGAPPAPTATGAAGTTSTTADSPRNGAAAGSINTGSINTGSINTDAADPDAPSSVKAEVFSEDVEDIDSGVSDADVTNALAAYRGDGGTSAPDSANDQSADAAQAADTAASPSTTPAGKHALTPAEAGKTDTDVPEFGADSHPAQADGSEPAGFPIKGNADSMLYHVPGSPFYGRTVAEVWFRSAEAAEQAGFELPPSQRRTGK